MLARELIAASTVPLVLSVLAKGETYGYALIQQVRELSGGRIEWTEGMLYPVLHWMEGERMIEFARGHRGVKRVLGDLVAGEQGYVDLKKKLVKSAFHLRS